MCCVETNPKDQNCKFDIWNQERPRLEPPLLVPPQKIWRVNNLLHPMQRSRKGLHTVSNGQWDDAHQSRSETK